MGATSREGAGSEVINTYLSTLVTHLQQEEVPVPEVNIIITLKYVVHKVTFILYRSSQL